MAIENIDVANQINAAAAKQAKLLAKGTKELKDQLAIMRGIAATQQGVGWDDAVEDVRRLREALDDVGERAEDNERQFNQTRRALDEMSRRKTGVKELGASLQRDLGEKFPAIAGAAAGFFSGAKSGFSLVTNAVSAAVGAVSSLGHGLFSLGKSIIAIPFKILGGLVEMANNLPTGTAFAEAREAIRKDFGDFSEDLALTTKTMFRAVRGEVAETGLRAFRVFGNWAERLRAMHEVVKGMGNMATLFRDELRGAVDPRSTERVLAFQKGLGISAEQMRQVGVTAKTSGRTMSDVLLEITKSSTGFSDSFGVSQKVVARGIAEMNADIANFGSMTVHEMGRAATYVQKLGLEIKDVIGIIDRYDNFEDAAMGAAHLAQAFGANVDALQMMKEQDPTKRLDMLRKSMAAAGVDAESLSRQELKLLSQQTGLSEEAAKTAFSLKNQGVSMADLEKQQQKNEKRAMTQEEAMVRLAGSIERVIKSGQSAGGFFTQFFKGFERGVKRFSPFRRVLRFIRRDLRIVRWLGIQVGRAFVKTFPGVMDMVKGLLEFFNPRRFRKLKKDLSGLFESMFEGRVGFEEGIRKLTKRFIDFFTGTDAGQKILDGALKFGRTVVKWLAQGIRMAMKWVTRAIEFVADFIEDPTGVIERVKAVARSSKNPFVRMLKPLWDAISDHAPALFKAVRRLWEVVKPKLINFAAKTIGPAMKALIGTTFGPAIIQGILGSITGNLLKRVGEGIMRVFTGADGAAGAVTKGTNVLAKSKAVTKFGSKLGGALRVAGPVGLAVGAALGVSEGLDMFMDKIEGPFDETEKKMAAAGAGIIHGFTLGLLPDDLEVWIANGLAQISSTFFDVLTKTFGESFTRNLKEYMGPLLDFWGSLGDTIVALISGDEEKFDEAFDEMAKNLGKTLVHGLKFMVLELVPNIAKFAVRALGMVGKALTRGVKMIMGKASDLFVNMVRATLGDGAADAVKWAHETFGKVYDFLRELVFVDLPSLFTGGVDKFREFGNSAWHAFTDALPGDVLKKHTEKAVKGSEQVLNESLSKFKDARAELFAHIKGLPTPPKVEETEMEKAGISFEDMGMYRRIKDLDPTEIKANITKFKDEIVPLFVGGRGVKREDSLIGAAELIGNADEKEFGKAIGKISSISYLAGQFDVLARAMETVGGITVDPMSVQIGFTNINASVATMARSVTSIAQNITAEDVAAVEAAQTRIRDVAGVVEQMVGQVNDANEELSQVGKNAKPMKVHLKNLAKNLGVKNQKFTIEHDKVNLYVKLDVNMDAEQIAYAIKKGQWFQLERGPKGPPMKRHR